MEAQSRGWTLSLCSGVLRRDAVVGGGLRLSCERGFGTVELELSRVEERVASGRMGGWWKCEEVGSGVSLLCEGRESS